MGAAEVEKALSLVRDVILAQNNIYIRELLREHDVEVTASSTKQELTKLLNDAVQDEVITLGRLTEWMDETEGWGDAHVYLFNVGKKFSTDSMWKKKGDVGKYVCGAAKALAKVWDADTSVEYPSDRTLTGIQYDESARELTCVWHEGTQFLKRESKKDFDRPEADGYHYYYRAYRDAARRNVFRVVFRPDAALAAVFLPGVSSPKEHKLHRPKMLEEIQPVLALDEQRICSMADAIKELDAAAGTKAGAKEVQARNTRFNIEDGAAYVEFASDTDQGYAFYDPLKKVRKAVPTKDFSGGNATLHFALTPIAGKVRNVQVNLYGDFQRIRMWVHLQREDVWSILTRIRKALP